MAVKQDDSRPSVRRRVVFYMSSLAVILALAAIFWPLDRSDLRLIVGRDGQFGYITASGRMAIQPRWLWAAEFDGQGRAAVSDSEDGNCRWIDRSGKVVIKGSWDVHIVEEFADDQLWFGEKTERELWEFDEEGMLRVAQWTFSETFGNTRSVTQIGWLNKHGRLVAPPQWKKVFPFNASGLSRVVKDHKIGWINRAGEVVIAPEWDAVQFLGDERKRIDFDAAGLAIVRKGFKMACVSKTGELVLPADYDFISPFDAGGMSRVEKGGTFGWVDRSGEVVIPLGWDDASDFDITNLAAVKKGGQWGWIDRAGEVVIQPGWTKVRSFDSGGMAPAMKGDYWGWVDRTGEWVIPPLFREVKEFDSGGMAAVLQGYSDGWSWIDRKGNSVIHSSWDAVDSFDHTGTAVVVVNDLVGLIDRDGNDWVKPEWKAVFPPGWASDDYFPELIGTGLSIVERWADRLPYWGLVDGEGNLLVEPRWLSFNSAGYGYLRLNSADDEKFGTYSALFDTGTNRLTVYPACVTRFDNNGRAWALKYHQEELEDPHYEIPLVTLASLIDADLNPVINLDDDAWFPVHMGVGKDWTTWSDTARADRDQWGPRSYVFNMLADLEVRGRGNYTVKRVVEVSSYSLYLRHFKNWFYGEDDPIPTNEVLCHSYNKDGKLIWSSAWVPFEYRCWAVFALALIVAFLSRPHSRRRKPQDR